MDQQILANWLVQDLRPGKRFQPDIDPAARLLDVLVEMVDARDISSKAALDVAVNLGRLWLMIEVAEFASHPSLKDIHCRAMALLQEGCLEEASIRELGKSLRTGLENLSGNSMRTV